MGIPVAFHAQCLYDWHRVCGRPEHCSVMFASRLALEENSGVKTLKALHMRFVKL
jgi:hypothetical protein